MNSTASLSGYHYVVDEPLLRTIAAEIQAAIPGADSDLDLLVTVPDAWLATHSRFEETGHLRWKLAHPRIPIDLLLYSHKEVQDRLRYNQHVVTEAYHHGRELHAC